VFIEGVSWSVLRCEDVTLPHLALFELFYERNVLADILCCPRKRQRDQGHRQIFRGRRVRGGEGSTGEVGRARRGKGSHEGEHMRGWPRSLRQRRPQGRVQG